MKFGSRQWESIMTKTRNAIDAGCVAYATEYWMRMNCRMGETIREFWKRAWHFARIERREMHEIEMDLWNELRQPWTSGGYHGVVTDGMHLTGWK